MIPFSQNISSQPRAPAPFASNSPMQAMVASQYHPHDGAWYADTGATNHITTDMTHLGAPSEYSGSEQINLANGSGINISHVGCAQVQLQNSSKSPLSLNSLLHIPTATKNLISVSQFARDNNVFFEFSPHSCAVKCQDTKKILLKGIVMGGLYCFDHLAVLPSLAVVHSKHVLSAQSSSKFCSPSLFHLWHSRLGHPSFSIVNKVLQTCNLPLMSKNQQPFCHSCCIGKIHKQPFSNSLSVYNKPLQLIHSDVWGPAATISSNGFVYYVHFIDHFSKFTWVYFLKRKSDVVSAFTSFKAMVETQFNSKIQALQTDGGGEFVALNTILLESGIQHRICCPHTPEQNGLAERKHRHLVDMGFTLLANASLPFKYWDEAFSFAVYLVNRLPTPVLGYKSPYPMLYNKLPDYNFLKTFGCTCYPNLRPYNTTKMQFRSLKCTFIGYSPKHKGYKCLGPQGRIYISRDVIFDELTFLFASSTTQPSLVSPPSISSNFSSPVVSSSSPHLLTAPPTLTEVINTSNVSCSSLSPVQGSTAVAQSPIRNFSAADVVVSSDSSSTRYMLPGSVVSPSSGSRQSSSTRYLLPAPLPSATSPATDASTSSQPAVISTAQLRIILC